MANLLIKPTTGQGNKLIIQDQDGGDILTSADSGATIENATFPTIKLTPTATGSAPSGSEGLLYFDSDKNALMQYDGSEWLTVSRYSETGLSDATGGTISEYSSGATHYRIHAFYTSGIFTLNGTKSCDILIVGGGGGGGGRIGGGGGGGAVFHRAGYSLTIGTYNITVGAGGYGGTNSSTPGSMGGSSIAFGVTAYGGGPGKTRFATNTTDTNRANGGGGCLTSAAGTTGTTLSASGWTYVGGNDGATSETANDLPQGGGAGAASNGVAPASSTSAGGAGGNGTNAVSWATPESLGREATTGTSIRGAFYFAGGGGGSCYTTYAGGVGGNGGGGGASSTYAGGAAAGNYDLFEDLDGGAQAGGGQSTGGYGGKNSGGGGGAGAHSGGGAGGGQGGSGIVIIRYPVTL
jgi:hypothetical protein